ncbi:uncharacterized protein LOC116292452 [Actinia tenebrosa]|uniref:Uncharacterized protein LOC116292452 n=1 Tax=Actinia tenebrosa TaxID=6105 RepID=A0A6P8HSI7_ACTTE|nr:uncharacterized protein LOC116292452 [Actinia tenebrosa]
MLAEFLASIVYLIQSCTGQVLAETYENVLRRSKDMEKPFLNQNQEDSELLEEFTSFNQEDTIFQEFDPPKCGLNNDPQTWKESRPTFKKSFWECLKSVLLIQTLGGSLVGFVAVVIVFLDFNTVERCYEENSNFNSIPVKVQRIRVTAQTVEGFLIQLWDLCTIMLVFPLSLVRNLSLISLNILASFIDVTYRLYCQMYGVYRTSWMSFPLNVLFCLVILINNSLLSRHFCPYPLKKTVSLFFMFSAQFIFGIPMAFFLVYKLFPFYVTQNERKRIVIATFSPLLSAIPKLISRLGAQKLNGIIHPGTAHVLVAVIYGISAVVFRVLQAELTNISLFIALGIAHGIIDLLERITITMRDHIWEYLYRLVRRQRSRQPKYRSPRSRRFIADVSIQIMMQEATALITALGFVCVYLLTYSTPKPFSNYQPLIDFLVRAGIGLLIDLVFNVISLLIQTRVMNIAVNRVWKKKWRHHLLVNALLLCIALLYFSGHLFDVIKIKHAAKHHSLKLHFNCSYPSRFMPTF